MRCATILGAAFAHVVATAATSDYQCQVLAELSLEKSGLLSPYPKPIYLGRKFSVDRLSGSIVGEPLTNRGARISVLDAGGNGQAYKVMSVWSSSNGLANVTYLEVRDFEEGSEKPFVGAVGGTVFSGTCR
jgi:hypothetical protein